jgi:hypothetical protein
MIKNIITQHLRANSPSPKTVPTDRCSSQWPPQSLQTQPSIIVLKTTVRQHQVPPAQDPRLFLCALFRGSLFPPLCNRKVWRMCHFLSGSGISSTLRASGTTCPVVDIFLHHRSLMSCHEVHCYILFIKLLNEWCLVPKPHGSLICCILVHIPHSRRTQITTTFALIKLLNMV